ncbi:MAG: competence/damage-inducible protein A [Lachnospiraceae bacterium]|nr:competence/damage-inducible protein A [Lachnospiraceae bacterium]
MTVEIICVGTEILMGNIVNTNAAFLAENCAALGLSNYFQTVVGDNEERLTWAIETAMSRADIVLLSGGLGPTEDDLTKEVAAKVTGRKLIEDKASRKAIEDFFARRGGKPTENNWKQALVPEGAMPIPNPNGTAPGILIEEKKCTLILMPGPPVELRPMFENSVAPYLRGRSKTALYSRTVKICGVGESKVETMIKDLVDAQTNPTIATYAKIGEVHVRVTASAPEEKEAKKLVKPVVKELKSRFGNNIYAAEENISLEQAVVDLLIANQLTVATAESCTGGMLSARLINVPGVSEVLKTGLVTYSNKAKRRLLGVKKATLQKHTAVSRQVAEEMLKGLGTMTKADLTVSITGYAGPDAAEGQEIGLVYIGCGLKGNMKVKECHFSGNRQIIRERAVTEALTMMREAMMEYFSKKNFSADAE